MYTAVQMGCCSPAVWCQWVALYQKNLLYVSEILELFCAKAGALIQCQMQL